VTTDVAGRDLEPEEYQAQLRAVDASGDPVETKGQEGTFIAHGSDFSVTGGSAPTNGKARELNASGDVVQNTLTGLTVGTAVAVDCFLRKDLVGSAPVVKTEVWNVTDNVSQVSKNVNPDNVNRAHVLATLGFTPVSGKTYAVRVSWVSGTGIALLQKAEWHDKGNFAIWRETVKASSDDQELHCNFPLAHPRVWYYQCRVRCLNRIHGGKCWSAWSSWTTATNPVTGDPTGPPQIDGVTLTFDRLGGKRHNPFRATVTWNETPYYVDADEEDEAGAAAYAVKLGVSTDGGSTTDHTRRAKIDAKDADADTTATYEFRTIKRGNVYRSAVRGQDFAGRWGAWSAWTAWTNPSGSIGAGPGNPLNVTKTQVRQRVLRWTWDEPSNPEDVDRYRVQIYNAGSLRETGYTRALHYRYHVPDADAGTAHNAKVVAIDHEGNLSAEQDPGNVTDAGALLAAEEIGSIKKYGGGTPPGGWLKANGASYSTSSPYDLLFAITGYTYGGSGANFNVPDLRRRSAYGTDESTALIGDSDGIATVANREFTHTHANDATSTTPTNDATGDATGNTTFSNLTFDSTGEAGHAHFLGNNDTAQPKSGSSATVGGGNVAGQGHSHFLQGYSDPGLTHGHGHDHSTHAHNHGHSHGHGHTHGSHGHGHQHDNKSRPRLVCLYMIKYL
jgi:microcystin-dependent protein